MRKKDLLDAQRADPERTKNGSMFRRIFVSVISAIAFILGLNLAFQLSKGVSESRAEYGEKARLLTSLASVSFAQSLWAFDQSGMNRLTEAFLGDSNVQEIRIYDAGDSVISDTRRAGLGRNGSGILRVLSDIRQGDEQLGYLQIDFNTASQDSQVLQTVADSLIEYGAIVVLTLGLLYFLMRRALRPLQQLGDAIDDLAAGNFNITLDRSSSDEIGRLASKFKQMSDALRQRNSVVQQLAYHDSLTGLPNRTQLYDEINRLLETNKGGGQFALIFIDIDDFKVVNDNHGHAIGDLLLKDLADKISNCCGAGFSFAARLGGDEFVVINEEYADATELYSQIRSLWNRLSGNFVLADVDYYITVSMGISRFPEDGATISDLMRRADTALYKVKEGGKRSFLIFADELGTEIHRKMLLEKNLRYPAERSELDVVFQAQYDFGTKKITSFEALLRWDNPDLGTVSPIEFIPLAERTGLILPIGDWVLRQACMFSRDLNDAGFDDISISVNFSALQLMQPNFVYTVAAALSDYGVPVNSVTIEVTESVFIKSFHEVASRLRSLKAIGMKISLDDFGTGYSSLSYLQRLPFDELKIDKSFIDDLENNRKKIGIVRSLIALSQQHDLSVVAEGVETPGQFEILRESGCDKIQGFYISHPALRRDAMDLLRRHKKQKDEVS